MNKLFFLLLFNSCVSVSNAQRLNATEQVLQTKVFPFYSLLLNDSIVSRLIAADTAWNGEMLRAGNLALEQLPGCQSPASFARLFTFPDVVLERLGDRLLTVYRAERHIFSGLMARMRASGQFNRYQCEADSVLLRRAWEDGAAAINHVLDVYVAGRAPRYPNIDSISFANDDTRFPRKLKYLCEEVLKASVEMPFMEKQLRAASKILLLNGRDEAARYEPLEEIGNAAVMEGVRSTRFSDYPYSLILVPGKGPSERGIPISEESKYRCRKAVQRFRQGLAPFLIVSGGNVHPFRTNYNEAAQLKKFIVDSLNVDERSILIEPHARHTTTNLRNVGRMIYRIGIPAHMPVLIVTDASQAGYIVGNMPRNAQKELGYLPFLSVNRKNKEEVEFYPSPVSLHTDPFDPLDP